MKQFEGYEEYLKQSELSKQTRQVYLREAEKFVRYLNGKEITKDRTMLYREKLREEDLSPATINLYVIAVNRYLRYLECGQASIKTLKVQKKCSVENVISRKEYQELLNYAKSSGRKKYYYIMRTLALTGIRVSELQYPHTLYMQLYWQRLSGHPYTPAHSHSQCNAAGDLPSVARCLQVHQPHLWIHSRY